MAMSMTIRRMRIAPVVHCYYAHLHQRQMSSESIRWLNEKGLLRTQGLIGGKWVGARDGKTIPVHNPANQELLGVVPYMGASETKDAIASAHEAFPSWSKLTATERSKILRKWYELLMAHKEDLGKLMTLKMASL